ncbi:MAG: hypothetical protein KC731_14785, partial [Myxococcales bacterium]|nr:hypothetical protein [Myxococcales bacterium]
PPREEAVPAPFAILSQSGAITVSRASKLAPLSPRYLISVGNQIDLTLGDHLAHLESDPDLAVVACYVEGFRPGDGRAFLEATQHMAREGKLVLVHHAGRSPAGAAATRSHTASIASDAVVLRELARAAGALVTESLDELDDLIRLGCGWRERRIGPRVAALSNAGYECVTFADAADGLAWADLGAATRETLATIADERGLGELVAVDNPLDVTPMLDDAGLLLAAQTLLADPSVDLALLGLVPMTPALSTLDPAGGLVTGLGELWRGRREAFLAVVDAGAQYQPLAVALQRVGIPVVSAADRAMRAAARYVAWRRRWSG